MNKVNVLIYLGIFLCAAFFAQKNYFIQDDAYIAFVYSKNFAQGHGLVWYPGLDEYGYTNFLYTLFVGILMSVLKGIDPEFISAVINFISYIIALSTTYIITLNLSKSKFTAACSAIVLATNHTFSAYASGGLETMTVTALILAFYYVVFFSFNIEKQKTPLIIAVLASSALLTRLDSSILLFPGYLFMFCVCFLEHSKKSECNKNNYSKHVVNLFNTLLQRQLWIVVIIPVGFVSALLLWAKMYYGYAFPNTFYVKIPNDTSMVWLGKHYIQKYLELHYYIPAAFMLIGLIVFTISYINKKIGARFLRKKIKVDPVMLVKAESIIELCNRYPLIVITLLFKIMFWLTYVVYIGGCFMEFRLLVPILPAVSIFVFSIFGNQIKKKVA
jgi:arabinofuranosyltransferase